MKTVAIIGMGMSPADLTDTHLKLIADAEVLVGGKRHLACFEDSTAEKKTIDRNLKELVAFIRDKMAVSAVVVLASGDPLFFGIGSYLAKNLGAENVTIYPNISAPAAAFARLKEAWQAVPVVSLHGREGRAVLLKALADHPKVVVYTDPVKNPAWVAEWLQENGFAQTRICVLEQLGMPTEAIRWFSPQEAVGERFADPNIMVISHENASDDLAGQLHLGMPEAAFDHEQGLITKAEIRSVSLAKLELKPDHVFWDLGAGSGSVSVEASLFVTRGKLFAVEKNSRRILQIEKNKDRFRVHHLDVIEAVLPEGLAALPDPDRVFIGGGGRDLEAILRTSCNRLRPRGIVVVNTVLIQSMQVAMDVLQALGFDTDLVQLQVSRGSAMPYGQRLAAENPVWIVRGRMIG
jgi:precorrin-6Y C5,15-methyltransferase (decarboxylating)